MAEELKAGVEVKEETKVLPEEELGRYEPLSQGQLIWRRFRRHKLGMVGGGVILFFIFAAIFSDFIAPYDFSKVHIDYAYAPPSRIHFTTEDGRLTWPYVRGIRRGFDPKTYRFGFVETDEIYPIKFFVRGEPYKLLGLFETDIHLFGLGTDPNDDRQSGWLFLLGSDSLGRDLFSRILVGGRFTLTMGFVVILISFLIGVPLGGLSGYYGRWVDTILQKLAETFLALPRLALLLALAAALPRGESAPMLRFWGIALIIALVSWAPLTRVIRGQFLAIRESEFVLAARALGAGDWRIITRHILPCTMSVLVVSATLTIPNVIIAESTLSFLGYGIQDPLTSWGALLKDAMKVQNIMFYPWILIPGVFIIVTVLAFNFLGDALRDAVDPYAIHAAEQ